MPVNRRGEKEKGRGGRNECTIAGRSGSCRTANTSYIHFMKSDPSDPSDLSDLSDTPTRRYADTPIRQYAVTPIRGHLLLSTPFLGHIS
jgi:hypothetical protein